MTWEHKRRRWAKMHKGKRCTVTPSILSERFAVAIPETQDGSYQYANRWWEEKKLAIGAAGQTAARPLLPLEDVTAAHLGVPPSSFFDPLLALWRRWADSGSIPKADVQALAESDLREVIQNTVTRLLTHHVVDGQPLPEGIAERLPLARVNQIQDDVKSLRGEQAAATDRTVKAHAVAWFAVQEKQVAAGQVTAARVNNVKMALAHFARWLGEPADVAGIDAAKLQGFYEHCLTQVAERRKDKKAGWSLPFAKEVFAVARSWLKWLTEQGTIDPPRNLASRFRFGSTVKKIATWTVDEVQQVISVAPGKLKLALLLMINTGATQQDVSDLLDSEVNWRDGRIIRKRSKTGDKESTLVVNYLLWPATFRLLKQYRSGAEMVLLTESGKPYVRSEMVNGKLAKADRFTSNYAHLKRRLKFTKSMKLMRNTEATMLDQFDPSGRVSTLYLGHSPRSRKDRHYSRPEQAYFDQAIEWLGRQFGFVETVKSRPKKNGRKR